ncbi:hypothetical protein LTR91_024893 [Friedmanniomyces endolithicus]|uniref:Uncharacterized protein n=1 Tax=Friedmanniomyces endolithicus TaxID=329885 RepID=A0AAN6H1Z4_9PEZI|nr:hypothetical protein LTR03_016520 [Friedmanniomyces endolithicus]KAK0845553.1 hypothetical protein LTS02_015256 [Friedmanniomyces endolithicus]KAK0889061.1 hypothetical protein LTR02_015776 [Friedmanniomyces endolithicus]KAK0890996.1 hypothetical protein LTR57_024940 [Friedmanniomyces endolithicus]KAK0951595.1 hypothetical protein LTR91_024893 [Friedmanniomyces endolithicus]
MSASGVLKHAPRDYSMALLPLYAWLLHGIFDDERAMETEMMSTKPTGGVLGNGLSRGVQVIREGTTVQPVQGYGIGRDDIGL